MTDNLLDPSHVAWVHQSSFGNAATEEAPLETTVGENGVTVWRWMLDVEPAPFYAPYLEIHGQMRPQAALRGALSQQCHHQGDLFARRHRWRRARAASRHVPDGQLQLHDADRREYDEILLVPDAQFRTG